jgi:hypothetical protein
MARMPQEVAASRNLGVRTVGSCRVAFIATAATATAIRYAQHATIRRAAVS